VSIERAGAASRVGQRYMSLPEISPETALLRDKLVKQMAKNLGYNPSKVRYMHWQPIHSDLIYMGGTASSTGEIIIDGFAFDPCFLRNFTFAGPREILAHEIGHIKPYSKFSLFGEAEASIRGSNLPSLSNNERFNLLLDATTR